MQTPNTRDTFFSFTQPQVKCLMVTTETLSCDNKSDGMLSTKPAIVEPAGSLSNYYALFGINKKSTKSHI